MAGSVTTRSKNKPTKDEGFNGRLTVVMIDADDKSAAFNSKVIPEIAENGNLCFVGMSEDQGMVSSYTLSKQEYEKIAGKMNGWKNTSNIVKLLVGVEETYLDTLDKFYDNIPEFINLTERNIGDMVKAFAECTRDTIPKVKKSCGLTRFVKNIFDDGEFPFHDIDDKMNRGEGKSYRYTDYGSLKAKKPPAKVSVIRFKEAQKDDTKEATIPEEVDFVKASGKKITDKVPVEDVTGLTDVSPVKSQEENVNDDAADDDDDGANEKLDGSLGEVDEKIRTDEDEETGSVQDSDESDDGVTEAGKRKETGDDELRSDKPSKKIRKSVGKKGGSGGEDRGGGGDNTALFEDLQVLSDDQVMDLLEVMETSMAYVGFDNLKIMERLYRASQGTDRARAVTLTGVLMAYIRTGNNASKILKGTLDKGVCRQIFRFLSNLGITRRKQESDTLTLNRVGICFPAELLMVRKWLVSDLQSQSTSDIDVIYQDIAFQGVTQICNREGYSTYAKEFAALIYSDNKDVPSFGVDRDEEVRWKVFEKSYKRWDQIAKNGYQSASFSLMKKRVDDAISWRPVDASDSREEAFKFIMESFRIYFPNLIVDQKTGLIME